MGKTLTIFGASGGVGKAVVRLAREGGHRVVAVEHSWPADAPDDAWVRHRTADILSDDLESVIRGSDAVVSCVGLGLSPSTALNPPPLYTEGTLRIVQGMKAADVRRLVVISASFVETMDRGPVWFRAAAGLALCQVFRQMGEMERILRATDGIDWTAVRPGWLYDAPGTKDAQVTDRVIPEDTIRTRIPDLAAFMLDCAETGRYVRQTPAIARKESAVATSPFEVLREAFA